MARKPVSVTQTRRAYLEAAVAQHERQAREAAKAKSFAAAVAAKKAAREARSELDQLNAADAAVSEMAGDTPAELLRGILVDVRRMRVSATEAGSYVAAERLIKTEAEIVGRMAAQVPPPVQLTGDELVAAAVAELQALPPDLRTRILEGMTE